MACHTDRDYCNAHPSSGATQHRAKSTHTAQHYILLPARRLGPKPNTIHALVNTMSAVTAVSAHSRKQPSATPHSPHTLQNYSQGPGMVYLILVVLRPSSRTQILKSSWVTFVQYVQSVYNSYFFSPYIYIPLFFFSMALQACVTWRYYVATSYISCELSSCRVPARATKQLVTMAIFVTTHFGCNNGCNKARNAIVRFPSIRSRSAFSPVWLYAGPPRPTTADRQHVLFRRTLPFRSMNSTFITTSSSSANVFRVQAHATRFPSPALLLCACTRAYIRYI